jgi:DNA-binding response OmpR family regulator
MPGTDCGSILVVDDEPHVSEMLQEFFADLGYSVDVAATGAEAFRRASSKRPDAVILDMRLPDTTGDQLLTRLRTLDGSLPIVMLSGDVDDDVARRTMAAGAVQYLHKPFDFAVLERTITRAVGAVREDERPAASVAATR